MKMISTIPAMPVTEIEPAVGFYVDKLGFTCAYRDAGFARLIRDEVEVHLWAANDSSWKNRNLVNRPIASGAESFLAGTSSCRIEVQSIDDLFVEYQQQAVLYAPDTKVKEMPWGTREFPALDLHRNLLTFYERKNASAS